MAFCLREAAAADDPLPAAAELHAEDAELAADALLHAPGLPAAGCQANLLTDGLNNVITL
jgi:hypothetical protein